MVVGPAQSGSHYLFERFRQALRYTHEVARPIVLRVIRTFNEESDDSSNMHVDNSSLILSARASGPSSSIRLANELSDAFLKVYGFRPFGYGLEVATAVSIVEKLSVAVGKVDVVVAHSANLSDEVITTLLGCNTSSLGVRFIENPTDPLDLRLSHLRAVDATVPSRLSDVLESRVPVPNLRNGSNAVAAVNDKSNQAVERARISAQYGRWSDAIEIASSLDLETFKYFLMNGYRRVMEIGEHDSLLSILQTLPEELRNGESDILYVELICSSVCGMTVELAQRITAHLHHHEAPNLRARWAASYPSHESLQQARRAYESVRSLETCRSLGFCCALAGDGAAAISAFQEALHFAHISGDAHAVATVAFDISHALFISGDWRAALQWSSWSLNHFVDESLDDELLRLNLVTMQGYLLLVSGRDAEARSLIQTVSLPVDKHPIPMLDSLISTRADLAYFDRDFGTARQLYEHHVGYVNVSNAPWVVVDLVKACIADGDVKSANDAISRVASLKPEQIGKVGLSVARAMVLVATKRHREAIEQLNGDFSDLNSDFNRFGAVGTQAAIVWLSAVDGSEAKNGTEGFLEAIGNEMCERMISAAEVLSPWPDQTLSILHTRGDRNQLAPTVRLLGKATISEGGVERGLLGRSGEILALFLIYEDGLSTQQFALELFGERVPSGTVKATISRFKKRFALGSRPYRLIERPTSDLVEIMLSIQSGDIPRSLELYKGPLLPDSDAPGIVRHRERIDEALRQAVVHSRDPDLVLQLAHKMDDDLEVWELAAELLPKNDPAYPLVLSRVRRIKQEWEV